MLVFWPLVRNSVRGAVFAWLDACSRKPKANLLRNTGQIGKST